MHGSEKLPSSPLGLTSVMTWGAVALAVVVFAGLRVLQAVDGGAAMASTPETAELAFDDFASAGVQATADSARPTAPRRDAAPRDDNDAAKAAARIEEQPPTF